MNNLNSSTKDSNKARKIIFSLILASALTFLALFFLPQITFSSANSDHDHADLKRGDEFINPAEHMALAYSSTWNTEGVDFAPGQASVTTADGVQITLKEGFLVTSSIALVECPETTWFENLIPSAAQAGHDSDDDPSRSAYSLVESLTDPSTTTMELLLVDPARYCQVHYLVGPGAQFAAGSLPDNIGLSEISLTLTGTFTLANGETSPFALETSIAWGGLYDTDLTAYGAGDIVTVTLQRDLADLLNALDPDRSEEANAQAVLRALVDSIQVSFESK
jgi:hypothetical protein